MHKTHEKAAQTHQSSAHDNKLIMLVDDDPVFRRVTSGYLSSLGYQVLEAENGLEGLRKLRDSDPDLIVCDLAMPVLNGIEFVEEVSMAYPALPLIVVSGTEAMSDVAQALRYGIKDFLPKPIRNHANLGCAIENTLADAMHHAVDQRDFASQWFRVDGGDLPEEQELHWHLAHLQQHPEAAKTLLHALLPEQESVHGEWKCSYRLLQSATTMPLVFDYAWLMDDQWVFYLVDTASNEQEGVATTLMIRALFHDYLRHLPTSRVDLKDLATILEKGIAGSDCTGSIHALLGVADLTTRTMTLLPAGLETRWQQSTLAQPIAAGAALGEQCVKNFITSALPLGENSQLLWQQAGTSHFRLTLAPRTVSTRTF